MTNPKKTQELTLKIIEQENKGKLPRGVRPFKYEKPHELLKEELFLNRVCRKTRDDEGNETVVKDKQGNPVFYQLKYFLESDSDLPNEDQQQLLLQDPRYNDPVTGKARIFPYKTLINVVRVQTQTDNKEWLTAFWGWEGLGRDKQIYTYSSTSGVYDHPTPVTELRQLDPGNKDSPIRHLLRAIDYTPVYDIPFTKENYEKELAKRSAPRDERHIVMTLKRILPSGIRYPNTFQVLDKEQFLTRPFDELWDYLASAPLKDTSKTKMGHEDFDKKNNQYG
jgi:hypothetical protein